MKKILITGGAGFIGSHLCKRLLAEGNQVICLDNMFTGTYKNIQDLMNSKNFQYINANIIDPLDLDAGIEEIYNLACPASPIHYQYDPIMTIRINFLGAYNVLEYARKNNARVLQASTSEIYGDPIVHPQREDYRGNVSATGPRACYDEGKRAAETLFFDYNRMYHVDVRVIRIFNTYGPHMAVSDGRVVSNFIVQALKNKDITIYGEGLQTRSFCYVDDLVEGMIRVMEKKDFHGPVNLGNEHEICIKELAEIIIRKTGSSSKLIYGALPQDDPIRRKPDISLARKVLDWEPVVDIEEGIARTIDYFRM